MLTAESHYCTCLYRHLPRISPALFLAVSVCHALPESHYTASWCAEMGGQAEVTLADGTRADCVLERLGYAVEVERAQNWLEAPGQAMWYAFQTNLQPGIVLIVGEGEETYGSSPQARGTRYDAFSSLSL